MANQLSSLFVTIGAKTEGFHKAMGNVQTKLQNVSKKMGGIGLAMAGSAAAIGGAGIKMAADFDGAMREVNTMMQLNEDEFKKLSDETREMARTMGIDAVDASNALYQAISAGVPKDNAVDFLKVASKAAIGGVTDTETAVDGITTAINAFGLESDDAEAVADSMFTAVKGGKTTFEELAASMANVAPAAAAADIPLGDVNAAIATLTAGGTPTAQATTQIRAALVGLLRPSEEMTAIFSGLGYESAQAAIKNEGLQFALDAVADAAGGDQGKLTKLLASVEAVSAANVLAGTGSEKFTAELEAQADSAGASEDAFREMEKTTGRQLAHLRENAKNLATTIGTALLPPLMKLIDALRPIIEGIGEWVSKHPKLAAAILVIIGAIGGLLVVIGPLVSLIGGIITAAPILGAAFTALLGPVGLVILIIAGVVAAGIAIVKNWDWIKETAGKVWDSITGFISEHAGIIKDVLLAMTPVGPIIKYWDEISAAATWIFDKLVDFFSKLPERIGKAFRTVKDFILAPFRAAIEGYQTAINWLIDQVNQLSISIPSWVPPPLGGKTLGFNLPTVSLPSFATGGIVTSPTMAMVGEGGPEAIVPLDQMGETYNFNFDGAQFNVRSDDDIRRIARELERIKESKGRARGLSFAV